MVLTEEVVVPLQEDKPIYLKEHEEHWMFSSLTVLHIKNVLGEIEMKVCDECGYEDVKCLHIKNTVSSYTITCLLCGG